MLNTEPSISQNQNKEPRIYCFNQQITDANVPNAFTAPTEWKILIPVTDQLLTTSRADPHIWVPSGTVSDVRSAHSSGESENENHRVGTGIGEPDAVAKFIEVLWHAVVKVGAGFGGHVATSNGGDPEIKNEGKYVWVARHKTVSIVKRKSELREKFWHRGPSEQEWQMPDSVSGQCRWPSGRAEHSNVA